MRKRREVSDPKRSLKCARIKGNKLGAERNPFKEKKKQQQQQAILHLDDHSSSKR